MRARFALGGCSKVKGKEKRISIHVSLFYDDPQPETRKIRCCDRALKRQQKHTALIEDIALGITKLR